MRVSRRGFPGESIDRFLLITRTSAIEFLKQCELLKIEDLIPFFPDFVVIDDFKVWFRFQHLYLTTNNKLRVLGGNLFSLGRIQ